MLHVDQRFAKLLGEFAMRRKINFIVLENQFVDKGLQKIVNVIATKMSVAVGGENLINVAVASGNELENGDIESAAAEFDADDVFARWIDAERKQLQFILDIGGTAAHQALDGINGALGLREKTATRRFANGNTAIGIEADNRGTKRAAVRTLDTLRLARLRIKIGDEAVGGAE